VSLVSLRLYFPGIISSLMLCDVIVQLLEEEASNLAASIFEMQVHLLWFADGVLAYVSYLIESAPSVFLNYYCRRR
jgi:hypothetical protein